MNGFRIDCFGRAKIAQQGVIAKQEIQHGRQELRLGRAALKLLELKSRKGKEAQDCVRIARNAG